MADSAVKIQLTMEEFKEFGSPKPILGMVVGKTISNVTDFDYYFESPENGSFVQICFDIRVDEDTSNVFIIGKFVATSTEILDQYIGYYREMEKRFPMNVMDFRNVDKKIVAKVTYKKRTPEVVHHFKEKRKGAKYLGNFVNAGDFDKKTDGKQ